MTQKNAKVYIVTNSFWEVENNSCADLMASGFYALEVDFAKIDYSSHFKSCLHPSKATWSQQNADSQFSNLLCFTDLSSFNLKKIKTFSAETSSLAKIRIEQVEEFLRSNRNFLRKFDRLFILHNERFDEVNDVDLFMKHGIRGGREMSLCIDHNIGRYKSELIQSRIEEFPTELKVNLEIFLDLFPSKRLFERAIQLLDLPVSSVVLHVKSDKFGEEYLELRQQLVDKILQSKTLRNFKIAEIRNRDNYTMRNISEGRQDDLVKLLQFALLGGEAPNLPKSFSDYVEIS